MESHKKSLEILESMKEKDQGEIITTKKYLSEVYDQRSDIQKALKNYE